MVVLMGGAIAGVVAVLGRAQRARERVWAEVAARRGGSFHPARGPLRARPARLVVPCGEGTVTMELHAEVSSAHSSWTRCWGAFQNGRGPRMWVGTEGVLSRLTGRRRAGTVVLGGDREFDRTFVVRGQEPAVLRALWTPWARHRMYESFQEARVESDGATVTLIEHRLYRDAERVEEALDLIIELVTHDPFGRAALRQVAGAGAGWDRDGRPQAVVEVPVPVTLRAEEVGGRLRTVARRGDDGGLPALELEIDDRGDTEPAGLAGKLPAAARAHLRAARPGTLIIEPGAARFVWTTVETRAARLQAGAQLLGGLGGGGAAGVYR